MDASPGLPERLVLKYVVLWNTSNLNAALDEPRAQGYPVQSGDVARL